MSMKNYRQFSPSVFFVVNGLKRDIGAPRLGGAEDISMFCCMCEPQETAQSLGDDTNAVVTGPKVGNRARTWH